MNNYEVNVKRLAEEFDVSERTIYRDRNEVDSLIKSWCGINTDNIDSVVARCKKLNEAIERMK